MTFGEYWNQWVARRRRLKDIRESTLLGYISHHATHFGEVLDSVRLDRVFVSTVEAVFARIDEKNAALLAARASDDPVVRASVRGQRPTGPVTKQRIRATIRTVLGDAERERLVSFNAAALVKLDGGQKAKAVVWTNPRAEAFSAAYEARLTAERTAPVQPRKALERFKVWLATPRPSPVMVNALYHLIAFRGLRRGEACGARWVDGDLDEGLLAMAKQLSNVGREVKEGKPKTAASDAVVALDQVTVAVLRAHRKRQLEEKFTQENGAELPPDWVSEHFERLTFAAGLPPIRLHDFRHGAATLSLAAGNDMKTTSEMLRHSSLSITADLYTTVLQEVARSAAEAFIVLVPRAVAVGEASETGGPPSVPLRAVSRPTDSSSGAAPLVE
ncbi:tyrosine-type recombinase/integrase [Nonomuraea sp. H19]|uniref:tyrosine-type recombinase/integrase n=1 Tax=Nonomuraea sp. H19 TaxID=3452206 RepID=UPI003F8B6F7A